MAHYLRDEHQKDLLVDEAALRRIDAVFLERWKNLLGDFNPDSGSDYPAFLTYIIRFDNKGYRVFDLDTLLNYFRDATDVQRVIFMLQDRDALQSNNIRGAVMELRLDAWEPNNCYLSATSEKRDWVEASFSAVSDALSKSRTRNRLFRNAWTALLIQLLGVLLGFSLSLWAASKIAPNLAIENAFLISFLAALLIFSNLWTYLNNLLQLGVLKFFPNLKFYRPTRDAIHWLSQALVGGIVVAATLFLLGKLFSFIGAELGAFVRATP